jgi:hypothetical protein
VSWIQKNVSAAVVEANRRNAIKSTGPRTEAGKRRVGRNAGKYDEGSWMIPTELAEIE